MSESGPFGAIGVAMGSVPQSRVPILIVDDKPQNLMVLADLLTPLGEEIIQAQSGKEALRVLLQREVAIILLDVQMPDIDGYELAEPGPPAREIALDADHLHHRP